MGPLTIFILLVMHFIKSFVMSKNQFIKQFINILVQHDINGLIMELSMELPTNILADTASAVPSVIS